MTNENLKLNTFLLTHTNDVSEQALEKIKGKDDHKIGYHDEFGYFVVRSDWKKITYLERGRDKVQDFKSILLSTENVFYKDGQVSRVRSGGNYYPRISVDGKELAKMGWEYGDALLYEYNKAQGIIVIRLAKKHDRRKVII